MKKLKDISPTAIVDDVKRTGRTLPCGVCGEKEGMEDCVRVTYSPGGDVYVHATGECYGKAMSDRGKSFWAGGCEGLQNPEYPTGLRPVQCRFATGPGAVMRYEHRGGGRGSRDLWFFTLFDDYTFKVHRAAVEGRRL